MSPDPTATPPATFGRGSRAPTDHRYVRDIIERLHVRLNRIENNRTPAPLRLHQMTDTPLMSQSPAGHAATYDENTGMYIPSPNLAILTFDLIGDTFVGSSPKHWSRYTTKIVGISWGLGTSGGGTGFDFKLNGTVEVSATATGTTQNAGIYPPLDVVAYTDVLTVDVTSVSSGDKDLVVQIELGSNVAGQPGPLPFNTT